MFFSVSALAMPAARPLWHPHSPTNSPLTTRSFLRGCGTPAKHDPIESSFCTTKRVPSDDCLPPYLENLCSQPAPAHDYITRRAIYRGVSTGCGVFCSLERVSVLNLENTIKGGPPPLGPRLSNQSCRRHGYHSQSHPRVQGRLEFARDGGFGTQGDIQALVLTMSVQKNQVRPRLSVLSLRALGVGMRLPAAQAHEPPAQDKELGAAQPYKPA